MPIIRKRPLRRRDGTPSGAVAWQVDFIDHLGKRRMRQFKTRKGANAFLESALALKRDGRYVHAPATITVAEAMEQWERYLDARVKSGMRMEERTRGDYVGKAHLHIRPYLGEKRLAHVTTGTVHSLKDSLMADGRSPATVRKVLSVLVQLFRFCVERELMPTNPAIGVKVEKSDRDQEAVLVPSREQVGLLIEKADLILRPMLIVTVFCGLRSGELRGLTWADVDLDAGLLAVNRRADDRGRLGPPKTRSGRRRIPIGPFVANSLRQWRLRCMPSPQNLAFPNRAGKPWRHDNLLHRHWYPLLEATDLKGIRWHDLRHFAISLWIAQGLSARVIKEYAGHSGFQITMDTYGHLFPEDGHHDEMAAAELSVVTSTTGNSA